MKGYNDYYPFGLRMSKRSVDPDLSGPGRSMNTALNYALYKFSGKELDEENGINWYYFGARYYDPMIGRWLSMDPAIIKWSPQRIIRHRLFYLSPYVYVRNNPINRFDMDGFVDWNKVLLGGLGIIGGITEAVTGGVVTAGTGVTGIGAVGGTALMVHGFSTTGFGMAMMISGFKDNKTNIPAGPLEAIGGEIAGKTGGKVGAVGDALTGALSSGNPLKLAKEGLDALPTSARAARKLIGYQKKVAKKLFQATNAAISDAQAGNNTIELIKEIRKEEENKNKNNDGKN